MRVVDSAVPQLLLSAIDVENKKKEAAAAVMLATAAAVAENKRATIKLMRRSPGDPRAPNPQQGQGNGGPEKQVKTVEDREREYAEARARIFGTNSPPLAAAAVAASPPAPPPLAASPTVSTPGAAASSNDNKSDSTLPSDAKATAGERTAEAGSPVSSGSGEAAATSEAVKDTATKDKGDADDMTAENSADGNEISGEGGGGGAESEKIASSLPPDVGAKATPADSSSGKGVDGNSAEAVPTVTAESAAGSSTSPKAAKVTVPALAAADAGGSATTPGTKAGGKQVERDAKQAGGAIASQGPDGTTGFGRGRGKPLPGGGGKSGASGGAGGLQGLEGGADRGDHGRGKGTAANAVGGSGGSGGGGRGSGRGNRRPPVNAGEWKGQRGMQRNRMAEKSDPDFVRNYDNYRPSFAPYRQLADPSGGGGYGVASGRGAGAGGGHGHQPLPSPRLLHQHQVCIDWLSGEIFSRAQVFVPIMRTSNIRD